MMLRTLLLTAVLVCPQVLAQNAPGAAAQSAPAAAKTMGVLSAAELQPLIPPTVYFSGQVATVQLRNSGGVRGAKGKLTMFVIVDSSGYSSGLRERYQFYLLTDTEIEIAGKRLKAGAYGGGFLSGTGLEVMDLGGEELFHAPTVHDAGLARPRPLQVIAGGGGSFRLYLGRDYVEFRQIGQ